MPIFPGMRAATAAKYDLIVKGGRVIDPSRKLNAILDVAIAQGQVLKDHWFSLGRLLVVVERLRDQNGHRS